MEFTCLKPTKLVKMFYPKKSIIFFYILLIQCGGCSASDKDNSPETASKLLQEGLTAAKRGTELARIPGAPGRPVVPTYI